MSSIDKQGKLQQMPEKYRSHDCNSNSPKKFTSYTTRQDEISSFSNAKASYLVKQNEILSSSCDDKVFSDVPDTPTKYLLKSKYHSLQIQEIPSNEKVHLQKY